MNHAGDGRLVRSERCDPPRARLIWVLATVTGVAASRIGRGHPLIPFAGTEAPIPVVHNEIPALPLWANGGVLEVGSKFGVCRNPLTTTPAGGRVVTVIYLEVAVSVSFSLSRGTSKRMLAASVVGLLVASSIALIAGPAQATTAGFTAANGIVYGPSAGDGTITAIGYTGSDTTVVIPATVLKDSMTYPVTAIGEYAFMGKDLSSITLSDGLIKIDSYALGQNPMTAITIPASVTYIGQDIFYEGVVVSVTFAGLAPTTLDDSNASYPPLGWGLRNEGVTVTPVTVHYLSQFGATGGFTTPTWMGYNTVIDPIVSFESNGHGTIGAQRLIAGQLAVDPVPTDADLDGWFTTADFTTEFDFSVAPTDDVTVYAKWPLAVVVAPEVSSSPTLTLNLGLAVGDTVAGALVAVSGAGLKEGSSYTIILRSTPVLLAGGTIDSSGAFTASAVLPTGLSAGQHTVTLTGTAADGSSLSRVAFLTVSATGTVTYLSYTAADAVLSVTATSTTTALASTGFTAAPLGFAALLLLLAGAALVAARRRSIA